MKSVTITLTDDLNEWLSCRASERNTTKAELIKSSMGKAYENIL